jgi:hypothetical protein
MVELPVVCVACRQILEPENLGMAALLDTQI